MAYPIKPTQLLPLEAALASMFALLAEHPSPTSQRHERVALDQAVGRINAEDIFAPIHLPPFSNSMMDGYALRKEDWRSAETPIPIHQRIAAGQTPKPLPAGYAARIFTGAPLPEGANAVLMQEACREENGQVWMNEPPSSQWINTMGQDTQQGECIMSSGLRLTPSHLGVLAGVGFADINVVQKLKVAIVATGDELISPGTISPSALPLGKIFNSNLTLLQTLLPLWGAYPPTVMTLPDDRAHTEQALAKLAENHTLILTSGGASVGEEDHVRAIMQAQHKLSLWQLAIKPGKPFMFGQWHANDSPCYLAGLPGNPVAAWVTALLLVRPLMLALQGNLSTYPFVINDVLPPAIPAVTDFDWLNPDKKRREFIRVQAQPDWACGTLKLSLMPNQKSAVLTSVSGSDGLLDNPIGNVIKSGDVGRFIPFFSLY